MQGATNAGGMKKSRVSINISISEMIQDRAIVTMERQQEFLYHLQNDSEFYYQ